jgi:DNA polymerase sliding clamp subunit (PCNA homolog)
LLTSEKIIGVKLKTKGGVLEISAHNPHQKSAEEKIKVEGESGAFCIPFYVYYLKKNALYT